jgi:DNA-binding NtrC family response regulator
MGEETHVQKLLLVEDDPEKLAAIQKAAAGQDRELIAAQDISHAIGVLREQDIDLVVTDLALRSQGDDTEGIDVLQAAKAKDENLPVILISAYLTRKLGEQASSLGAFDVIDRSWTNLEPDEVLRSKIGLALKYRSAVRNAARFSIDSSQPA